MSAESVAALVGLVGGLIIVIATFELPLLLIQRRVRHDRGRLRVLPLTFVIALVCVLISRTADFQPGYLYGVVAGYAHVTALVYMAAILTALARSPTHHEEVSEREEEGPGCISVT